jgi:hypothetical protein
MYSKLHMVHPWKKCPTVGNRLDVELTLARVAVARHRRRINMT